MAKQYIFLSSASKERLLAQNIFISYLKRKQYISGFVTQDKSLIGLKMFHKNIEEITNLDKNSEVIFAAELKEKYEEQYEDAVFGRRYDAIDSYEDDAIRYSKTNEVCFRMFDAPLFNRLIDKKVFVYGIDENAREAFIYLELLDYEVAGFLKDSTDKCEDLLDGYHVESIEEILYEENFYIWVEKKDCQIIFNKLEKLGLKFYKDYGMAGGYTQVSGRKTVLDINLGYSYKGKSKYPGITVYGDEKNAIYKIAVTGGSTTDGSLYPFKAWPEILYDLINDRTIAIYNGGVGGYTSGEELLKLMRDMLLFNPNMVIAYSGINDTSHNEKYPFKFDYLDEIFNFAFRNLDISTKEYDLRVRNAEEINYGVESGKNRFENWLNNMKSMYALCIGRGITFHAFMQPMFMSKKNYDNREKNMMLSYREGRYDKGYDFKEFREIMKSEGVNTYTYLHDLSHIFDDISDVYMDAAHVWEKGNKIIAEEIFSRVEKEIHH